MPTYAEAVGRACATGPGRSTGGNGGANQVAAAGRPEVSGVKYFFNNAFSIVVDAITSLSLSHLSLISLSALSQLSPSLALSLSLSLSLSLLSLLLSR